MPHSLIRSPSGATETFNRPAGALLWRDTFPTGLRRVAISSRPRGSKARRRDGLSLADAAAGRGADEGAGLRQDLARGFVDRPFDHVGVEEHVQADGLHPKHGGAFNCGSRTIGQPLPMAFSLAEARLIPRTSLLSAAGPARMMPSNC